MELNSWGVNSFDSFSFPGPAVKADNGQPCAHNSHRKYLTPDPAFSDSRIKTQKYKIQYLRTKHCTAFQPKSKNDLQLYFMFLIMNPRLASNDSHSKETT